MSTAIEKHRPLLKSCLVLRAEQDKANQKYYKNIAVTIIEGGLAVALCGACWVFGIGKVFKIGTGVWRLYGEVTSIVAVFHNNICPIYQKWQRGRTIQNQDYAGLFLGCIAIASQGYVSKNLTRGFAFISGEQYSPADYEIILSSVFGVSKTILELKESQGFLDLSSHFIENMAIPLQSISDSSSMSESTKLIMDALVTIAPKGIKWFNKWAADIPSYSNPFLTSQGLSTPKNSREAQKRYAESKKTLERWQKVLSRMEDCAKFTQEPEDYSTTLLPEELLTNESLSLYKSPISGKISVFAYLPANSDCPYYLRTELKDFLRRKESYWSCFSFTEIKPPRWPVSLPFTEKNCKLSEIAKNAIQTVLKGTLQSRVKATVGMCETTCECYKRIVDKFDPTKPTRAIVCRPREEEKKSNKLILFSICTILLCILTAWYFFYPTKRSELE